MYASAVSFELGPPLPIQESEFMKRLNEVPVRKSAIPELSRHSGKSDPSKAITSFQQFISYVLSKSKEPKFFILPHLVPPNLLQPRFTKATFKFWYRPEVIDTLTKPIVAMVDNLHQSSTMEPSKSAMTEGFLLLDGVRGSGKSHSLYTLYNILVCQPKMFVAVYISSCQNWVENSLLIFREIHNALSLQFDDEKDAEAYRDPSVWHRRRVDIESHLEKHNLFLILILDQFNFVFNHLNMQAYSDHKRNHNPPTTPEKSTEKAQVKESVSLSSAPSSTSQSSLETGDSEMQSLLLATEMTEQSSSSSSRPFRVPYQKLEGLPYPWSLLHWTSTRIFTFLSASANNEPTYNHLLTEEQLLSILWHPVRWSEEEFDLIKPTLQSNLDPSIIVDWGEVKLRTGKVPLEVDMWVKSHKGDLDMYSSSRYERFFQLHQNLVRLDSANLRDHRRTAEMFYASANSVVPGYNAVFDRRLCYVESDVKHNTPMLHPISLVAAEAIRGVHAVYLMDKIADDRKLIMYILRAGAAQRAARGFLFEQTVISYMNLSDQYVEFPFYPGLKLDLVGTRKIIMKNTYIPELKMGYAALHVPRHSNYPYIDCFVTIGKSAVVAIQITINEDHEDSLNKMLHSFMNGMLETFSVRHFVWLAPTTILKALKDKYEATSTYTLCQPPQLPIGAAVNETKDVLDSLQEPYGEIKARESSSAPETKKKASGKRKLSEDPLPPTSPPPLRDEFYNPFWRSVDEKSIEKFQEDCKYQHQWYVHFLDLSAPFLKEFIVLLQAQGISPADLSSSS